MRVCVGDAHTFVADDGAHAPEDRCVCGAYTWGEMDRILETYERLEAMWAATP